MLTVCILVNGWRKLGCYESGEYFLCSHRCCRSFRRLHMRPRCSWLSRDWCPFFSSHHFVICNISCRCGCCCSCLSLPHLFILFEVCFPNNPAICDLHLVVNVYSAGNGCIQMGQSSARETKRLGHTVKWRNLRTPRICLPIGAQVLFLYWKSRTHNLTRWSKSLWHKVQVPSWRYHGTCQGRP